MSVISRFVTFRARAGEGEKLAERLLRTATLVGNAPGCEQWLVHRDQADPDLVRVSEIWAGREQYDSALAAEGVSEQAASVTELLLGEPEVIVCEPLGGAREIRGSTGVTRFAILDAPDLNPRYGLEEVGESRFVREQLQAAQTGLSHYLLRPGRAQGFAHRHAAVEEIYVALSGSGQITVDEQAFELEPLDAVRVAPASIRELQAGPDGLTVLAFGTHSPGDGEIIAPS